MKENTKIEGVKVELNMEMDEIRKLKKAMNDANKRKVLKARGLTDEEIELKLSQEVSN
jgi:hypothetical protein